MRLIATLLCCLALGANAETFEARVIMVMDGDTVLVLRGNQKIKVRMANIDAPEKEQVFGKQSRESLQEMVGKKTVQIDSQAVDQYGRVIGTISADGRNINQEQLKRGMAWEYSHYHSDKKFVAMQSDAQQARRGLWSQTSPQAPWQWRKLHPSVKPSAPNQTEVRRDSPVMLYDMECGKKRRCSEMTSCDEAHFYLTRCGVKPLDGNRDGQPCESLCEGGK